MTRLSETLERFLREIAARIDPERVIEVHLFAPIRQGATESGVAVIAAERPLAPVVATEAPVEIVQEAEASSEALAESSEPEPEAFEAEPQPFEPEPETPEPIPEGPTRLTIFRADYRHTLKGPDRGKWEIEVVAEADAPLETVDLVVRGVQKRAGEAIDADKMSGEQFRAALVSPVWSSDR